MSLKYCSAVLEEIITMLVSSFNLSQSFNYTPYLFYKKRFKSEINSFCILTQLRCGVKSWLVTVHIKTQRGQPPPPPPQHEDVKISCGWYKDHTQHLYLKPASSRRHGPLLIISLVLEQLTTAQCEHLFNSYLVIVRRDTNRCCHITVDPPTPAP